MGQSLARLVTCGGGEPVVTRTVEEMAACLVEGKADHVCLDVEQLPLLLAAGSPPPSTGLLLLCGSSAPSVLGELAGVAGCGHLFGLRYPEAPPRAWELVATIRRLVGGHAPEPGHYVSWGGAGAEWVPATDRDRDAIVGEVEQFAQTYVGRRAGTVAEAAHELLMNAMYDAPVDASGRALYAHDRTAAIELAPEQRPRFFCGCDGLRLVLSAADPFGRLTRDHVFGGLARSLQAGTMDQSGGGAGLGFMVLYRSSTLMFCDVVPGRRTRVTTVLELDVPMREHRNLPRSIHFFAEEP